MADRDPKPGKTPAHRPEPEHGPIRAITFNCVVRCGNRTLYPNGTFIPKEQQMDAFVDEQNGCLWLGYDGHWTRVPWESTGYVSFWPLKPEGAA